MHYGGVGPRTMRALLTQIGEIKTIFETDVDRLKSIEDLEDIRAEKIFEASEYLEQSEQFLNSLGEKNINYVTFLDDDYPRLLDELNDPPPLLFYRGRLPAEDEKTVAVVGSQEVGAEGINLTVELARRLAEKSVAVVSGLTRGIDTAAHIGALKGKGHAYAVVGSGLDNIHIEAVHSLIGEIMPGGGIISEYEPETANTPEKMTAASRLVVGLSRAVIIHEIHPESSGALDTAKFCHEIGKLMFLLLDPYEAGQSNAAAEAVLKLGAIPVWMEKDLDTIVKSLV